MDTQELKQRKLEEIKAKYAEQTEEKNRADEADARVQAILKQLLGEEARQRLNNVRLVNKELFAKALQAIVELNRRGYVEGKLGDAQVREILMQLKSEKQIKITRK